MKMNEAALEHVSIYHIEQTNCTDSLFIYILGFTVFI